MSATDPRCTQPRLKMLARALLHVAGELQRMRAELAVVRGQVRVT